MFCFFDIYSNYNGERDNICQNYPCACILRALGILGDFFSISQTERHSKFGRYDGLVYKENREMPKGYWYEWNAKKEKH